MPGLTPKFGIGDTVYLRESAVIGSLEAQTVAAIYQNTPTTIIYFMRGHLKSPPTVATFGDRITQLYRPNLYFEESELITYDEALQLVSSSLAARLDQVNAKLGGSAS